MKPTPNQKRAIEEMAASICVDAGAGSGKTRVLIERITRLLEQKAAGLDEIAAITFTEKAADEMKARLRTAFRDRAPLADSTQMSFWRDLERRVDAARLSTIHSFCMRLLKENALRLGLDPDFVLLADAEQVILREDVVTRCLHQQLEQQDAATERLTAEYSFNTLRAMFTDALNNVHDLQIYLAKLEGHDTASLLTHWREVVARERERALQAVQTSPEVRRYLRQLERFEGFCLEPEKDGRELWRKAMMPALRAILEEPLTLDEIKAQVWVLAEKNTKKRSFKKFWDSEETYEELKKLLDKIKAFAEKLVGDIKSDPEFEHYAAELTLDFAVVAKKVLEAYHQAKQEANGLDYDDLIYGTLDALRDNEALRERTARSITFLLIDEFQDTDSVQLEMARLLSSHPEGPDIFIVGDAKQSIYYFRGAEVDVFEKQRDVSIKTVDLDENFRTVPDVMQFVNDFFARSHVLDAVGTYKPLATRRQALNHQRVEFLMGEIDEEEDLLVEEKRRREAELIAKRIQELCHGDQSLQLYDEEHNRARPVAYGDFALLFSVMSNVGLYEEALRRAKIPYTLVAGAGFYEKQEIIDVLNLLKVVVEPWDEVALLGFLRSPQAGLSDVSLYHLTRLGPLTRVFNSDAVPDDFEQAAVLSGARQLIVSLRAKMHQPLAVFLQDVITESGIEAVLLGQSLGVQKAANVRKLINLAHSFASANPPSLRKFIRYLEEVKSRSVREGEAVMQPEGAGAVTLMTVHKSKGLEFPVVIVPDMGRNKQTTTTKNMIAHRKLGLTLTVTGDDGKTVPLPFSESIKKRFSDEELAEHARVLYVAMTRARDYLVLSGMPEPESNSWLEMLDAQYEVTSKGNGMIIAGDGWRARVVRKAKGATPPQVQTEEKTPLDRAAIEVQLQPVPVAPTRESYSISALLDYMAGGIDVEEEGVREEGADPETIPRSSSMAMQRGTLVHRMFELWDFKQDILPDLDVLVAEAGMPLGAREAAVQDLAAIAARFREGALFARLQQADTLLREAPFILNAGGALINGTIDLLCNGTLVVDYKTGRYHKEGHARYEWQLLLYAAAVHRLTGVMPTEGILAYVDEGNHVPVTITEEDIEAGLRHAEEVMGLMSEPR